MKKIGMIGLGAMGHGIAENILENGYQLVMYDVRPEAMTDLVEKGGEAAASLQELGSKVDTVLMIVNAYQHCCSVFAGLLETMNSGTIINMSTISMEQAQTLAKEAAAHGVTMLDSPVSGGTRGAAAGALTLMVGGDKALLEENRALLETFSNNVVHVGNEPGQGQAVKTINQLLVGVHMCATAEAFTLARKCGLDLQTVYDVICASAGMSRIFENRGQFAIEHNYDTRSTLAIQLKDTNIVCDTANAVGAPALLANVARELFKSAVQKYTPTDDSLEVMRLYEELGNMA